MSLPVITSVLQLLNMTSFLLFPGYSESLPVAKQLMANETQSEIELLKPSWAIFSFR